MTISNTESSAEELILAAEAALAREDHAATLWLANRAEKTGAEPDRCAGNRWLAYMLAGDFDGAWRESDAIRQRGRPDPHRFWMGEDLRGKRVILRSLHGFGDAVQMFRFLPRLQALASHLVVEVPPRLLGLAPCFDGMGEVVTWGEEAPAETPAWDVQIEVMELPYLLRVRADDLAPKEGYLHLPSELRKAAAELAGGTAPRVGVVWTAGHWNASRSVPFELLRGLEDTAGLEFWSLEGRHGREQDGVLPAGWRDVYELGSGLLCLAAVVERMDLVITVDTLAAHLAGALGVPCWLLLQYRADWRWMSGRDTSPWYPTLRLWRQKQPDDWAGLLQEVARALRQQEFTRFEPVPATLPKGVGF